MKLYALEILTSTNSRRKHILYSRDEGPISVPWDKNNQVEFLIQYHFWTLNNCYIKHRLHACIFAQVYLGYNNVAALTVLAGKQGWEASNINERVKIFFSVI